MIDVDRELNAFAQLGGAVFPGEREAIKAMLKAADLYGYGNMIDWLKRAWSKKLQDSGTSMKTADMAAGLVCVWCKTDTRIGKEKN